MARRVLVVDDEKNIVKGIRFSLEQEGFEVISAYDGEEALNQAIQVAGIAGLSDRELCEMLSTLLEMKDTEG